MKKFEFLLLILVVVLCCVSCSPEDSTTQYCQNSNHDLTERHVAATCQKTGFDSVYCKNCDYEVVSPIPKTSCVITTKKTTEDCCTVRVAEVCKYCAQEKASYIKLTHKYILKTHDALDSEDYYECEKCRATKSSGYKKVAISTNYDAGLNENTFVKISSDKISFNNQLGANYVYISDIIFKYSDGTEFKASEVNWTNIQDYSLYDVARVHRYDNTPYYPLDIELEQYTVRTQDVQEVYIEFTPLQYKVKYTYQIELDKWSTYDYHIYPYHNYKNWALSFTIDLFNPIKAQTTTVVDVLGDTHTLILEHDITVQSLSCDPSRGTGSYNYYTINLLRIET